MGVNCLVKLDSSYANSIVWEPITKMPELVVHSSTGELPGLDSKHRAFGFCFRGPAISEASLRKTEYIKEAYGVEVDGVHHVCIVLFQSTGQRLSAFSALPYALGLLPCNIMADFISGRDYHLAVYKALVSTDDPVLRVLKSPSSGKWFWHSSSVRRDL